MRKFKEAGQEMYNTRLVQVYLQKIREHLIPLLFGSHIYQLFSIPALSFQELSAKFSASLLVLRLVMDSVLISKPQIICSLVVPQFLCHCNTF